MKRITLLMIMGMAIALIFTSRLVSGEDSLDRLLKFEKSTNSAEASKYMYLDFYRHLLEDTDTTETLSSDNNSGPSTTDEGDTPGGYYYEDPPEDPEEGLAEEHDSITCPGGVCPNDAEDRLPDGSPSSR